MNPKEPIHIPEPWRAVEQRNNPDVYNLIGPAGADTSVTFVDLNEANTRRIVAAVNAVAGISTEALETGALREALVKAYQVVNYPYFHAHKGTSTEAIAAFDKLGIKGPAMEPAKIRAALAKVLPPGSAP